MLTRRIFHSPLERMTVKAGWFALIGGWCKRTALSPVVLKLKAKSPERQPGTSMYDCVDVNVTTYF